MFHSGFAAILGRPNAGKSTLLNALVGEKLAIISPKPQTTRNRILGIINVAQRKQRDGAQVVLMDTPGVHRPDTSLGRKMMAEVREAIEGCNVILFIVDVKKKWDPADDFVLDLLKKSGTPAFLLLNKIDLLPDKRALLPLITDFQKRHGFKEIIPISALRKKGLDDLLQCIVKALPQGPRYFPDDQITDQPLRFMAAEAIREQALLSTREEVPHAIAVIVDEFEEGEKLTRIAATIYCERDGQKAIILGKGGQMLKKIGTAARLDIEKMMGIRVYLELYVKVQPGWRESRRFVEELDWRRQLEQIAGTREPE
ncbi:MAG TPA: GTPase Era [Terriglobales bacterium]|nr:GTPase Era [Terriglobales bacterium]